MTTDFKKAPLKVSEDKLISMDPRQLVLATLPTNPLHREGFDENHPSYRESADEPVDLQTAESYTAFGFVGGAIEAQKIGPDPIVVDGRRRTRHFILANELQAPDRDADTIATKWGLPVADVKAALKRIPLADAPTPVKVALTQEDDADAFLRGTIMNHHRGEVSALTEAREIAKAKRLGKSLKEIALAYGGKYSIDTLKNRLKILEAPAEVQAELEKGTVTASDVIRMKHLPAPEQVAKLKTIPKKDPTKPASRRKKDEAATAKALTKSTGPRKPSVHQLTQVLDEIEDKTPAHYALRYALGLISIATAAPHIGLSKESPVYRHLKDRENDNKASA